MGFLQRCHERRNVSSFSFLGKILLLRTITPIFKFIQSKGNVKNLALLISHSGLCVCVCIYTYAYDCVYIYISMIFFLFFLHPFSFFLHRIIFSYLDKFYYTLVRLWNWKYTYQVLKTRKADLSRLEENIGMGKIIFCAGKLMKSL